MKKTRTRPLNAEFFGWHQFEEWANENGVGKAEDDWLAWWECWKAGYSAGQK
jgi:hypothetical protein